MGHSSKKKKTKKGGSGRRNKDHSSTSADGNELLSEEITALSAIFQEDCKIVTGPPTQIIIKISPHSKDMGFEDLDISAQLSVRCLPGYPYKSPKLKITPEKGLTENDLESLLSLLQEQASSNAREGRVMIFNLVEAAQEFLSQIVPPEPESKSVSCSTVDSASQLFQKELLVSDDKNCSSTGLYVYGFLDLFSGSGESWCWGLPLDDNRVIKSLSSDASNVKSDVSGVKLDKTEPTTDQTKKQGPFPGPNTMLDILEEESEDGNNSDFNTDTRSSVNDQLVGHEREGKNEDSSDSEQVSVDSSDKSEYDQRKSVSFISFDHDSASQSIEKELIMVHLLRLASSSKGLLPVDGFPNIISELCNLGVLSEKMQEFATRPSSIFATTFEHVFQKQLASSRVPQFWKPLLDLEGPTTAVSNSRYLSDFEELRPLGHGGFGHVVLCKNKLDGRQYAVKKIRLKDKNLPVDDRILRYAGK